MWDDLLEQDPKIRQMCAESEAQGFAQSIAAMQKTARDLLKVRFPLLAETAQAGIEGIKSLKELGLLIEGIAAARDEGAARRVITVMCRNVIID